MDLEKIVEKLLQEKTRPISDLIHNQYDLQNAIAHLKKDIRLHWEENRAQALELGDLLVRLEGEWRQYELPLSLTEAQIAALAQKIVEAPVAVDNAALPYNVALVMASRLKALVDAYRWRDDKQAATYARAIITMGKIREDNSLIALGLMALGDTLAVSTDRLQEAWDLLKQAAEFFLEDGNMVGWARTCTGRVGICIELERIEEALKEATLAQEIFHRYEKHDLFIRLSINLMRVFNDLGRYSETIAVSKVAIPMALSLKEAGEQHLGLLYNNVGNAFLYQGEFHQAALHFEQAKSVQQKLNNAKGLAIVSLNMAYVEQAMGQYHRALRILHEVLGSYENIESVRVVRVKTDMVECYLQLNRVIEANELSQEIIQDLGRLSKTYPSDLAHALRFQAVAEARLERFQSASDKLRQASDLFALINAQTWVAFVSLLQGRIALQQGEFGEALRIASEVSTFFRERQQQVNLARAMLLEATSLFALGDNTHSLTIARQVLQTVRRLHLPRLHYNTHLLLGQIQEARGFTQRCKRHYYAAIATIQRLQASLTITLRPDFLEDKDEAIHALVRLALKEGDVTRALEALELAKSLTLMEYLTNRQRLYWLRGDEATNALVDELEQLREEHHALYRQVYKSSMLQEDEPVLDLHASLQRLRACERRMRALTEQLYLRSAEQNQHSQATIPTLATIQASLTGETALIAYYYHHDAIWLFTVDEANVEVYPLSLSVTQLERLVEKLQFNIKCAVEAGATSSTARNLARIASRLGQKLYDALLEPVRSFFERRQRLIVVPYGLLHYVPFNLFHNGRHYLIEDIEMATLPSAGLITRGEIRRPEGAMVLAHSYQGTLPYTLSEAEIIRKLFPATLHLDDQTQIASIAREPVQILHVAAHGKHRIDMPDLSYIQLADGQLFTDDLLQQDLSYELVTLSACETGQSLVKRSGELIGLGRGVLAAGAGALVASLWRVDDCQTVELMRHFYGALQRGESKSAALRLAQCHMLQSEPALHPAYWGAFQLIGDVRPLSGRAPNKEEGKNE
jgi:CHAT domain-containing protein/predicted negative regulator of RcsB-dependent stress response